MRRAAFMFAALLFSLSAVGAPVARDPQIAFHNAFLMNLHHFLYDTAMLPGQAQRPQLRALADADRAALNQAAAFYKAHYASSDLLFDDNMTRLKAALSTDDSRQHADGLALPPALIDVLNQAAPVYARTLWPLHQRSNARWISQVRALDAVFGAEIRRDLARHLAHALPSAVVRVDLVYHSGTRTGAYTSEEPLQSVIPSARADYQGLAALEMLYHELVHTGTIDSVTAAIDSKLAASGKAPDTGLWHAVHFYTVGETVRLAYQRRAIAYQTYADSTGVYQRGFGAFLPAIDANWRPWMQGQGSFDGAVSAMVEQVAPAR